MINQAILTIQKWGSSLAIRIPAKIAWNVMLQTGSTVALTVKGKQIIIRPIAKRKLTLKERLKIFDVQKHRGETAESGRIGVEDF